MLKHNLAKIILLISVIIAFLVGLSRDGVISDITVYLLSLAAVITFSAVIGMNFSSLTVSSHEIEAEYMKYFKSSYGSIFTTPSSSHFSSTAVKNIMK